MAPIDSLILDLDQLLEPQLHADYGPNGLQVPGPREADTIVTAVSASVHVFEEAARLGAQLVLVHHGLFWKGMPQHVDAALHRRLRPLFLHDIALAAYHLPLDAHPEVGNNALLAGGLGAPERVRFGDIGFTARFAGDGLPKDELVERVRRLTGREPLHLDFGPARVRTLAIVSGGAAGMFEQAIAEGADAFLTGEPAERVMAQAREAGRHFLAAGHYATETFGIRRVGDDLARRHGLAHHFVDDPNPI
jgi:dinuclear metal center YbgI/SA1388 family protein